MLTDVARDRLQEVRLAEARASVDEERVVRLSGRFRHSERGRVREAVRRADDKGVEGVLVAQPFHPAWGRRGLFRVRRALGGDDADGPRLLEGVAHRGLDEASVVAVDPLAREVIPDREDECVVLEGARRSREPLCVWAVAERLSQSSGDLGPQALRAQLDWPFHGSVLLLARLREAAIIATAFRLYNAVCAPVQATRNMR